jgi:hypothetical protein
MDAPTVKTLQRLNILETGREQMQGVVVAGSRHCNGMSLQRVVIREVVVLWVPFLCVVVVLAVP